MIENLSVIIECNVMFFSFLLNACTSVQKDMLYIMSLLEILHQCQFLCPWWSSVPYDWWWRCCRSYMDGYSTVDRVC